MHEHSIINSIIKSINEPEKVLVIHISLGELANITSEDLKTHLEEGRNWKVIITNVKSKIKCICNYTGPAKIIKQLHDSVIYECPSCGLIGPEIIEGDKILITKLVY